MRFENILFVENGCFYINFFPVELEDFFGDHVVELHVDTDLEIDDIRMV